MTQTPESAAGRLPHGEKLALLRQHAKQLQGEEMARLFRRFMAKINQLTGDGLDPRIYADRINPPRRYSSAYF